MQKSAPTSEATSVLEAARRAKAASSVLARVSGEQKRQALLKVAASLAARADDILAANRIDLERARPLVESREMPESLYHRLKLDRKKLDDIVAGVEQVASMEEPIGRVTYEAELAQDLKLQRITCPIGVVGVIFESRPDALTQISSLCLKSSNAVLLKGGKEAEHSNRILFDIIQSTIADEGLPAGALVLLESREDVGAMLKAEGSVDLIIPRGSNALVRYVQQNTNIPVLGHADGLCHIYIDKSADHSKAFNVVIDAKIQYPAACNAVETLLVHREAAPGFLPGLVSELRKKGVEVRLDESAAYAAGSPDSIRATADDWKTEYCDLILSIKLVDSLDEAISHINTYGSRHTEAIITEDSSSWDRFFNEVDAAGVYLNASTRFADGYRYGFGAEVGISTGKLHPRGPVGLEGLITYKYKLEGNGQTVGKSSLGEAV